MARTMEEILNEAWKVPPQQTKKELDELKETLGELEYSKQYLEAARKNAAKRMSNPDTMM